MTYVRLMLCLLVVSLSGCAGLSAFEDSAGLLSQRSSADTSWLRGSKKQAEAQLLQQLTKARNFERSSKLDEAREVYEQLIVARPDRYEPFHRLAVVADRQRRHAEAQELYGRAIDLNPTEAELFNDLGYCFFLQGQLDKAASALTKAVALAPGEGRYQNNLGLVWGQMGRLDEALAAFRRAGSEADAHYNLAFIFASKDQADQAKTCFRKALAADPTHTLARDALQAFDRYDQDPLGLSHLPIAENGRRLVPYVESPGASGAVAPTDGVRQASYESPSGGATGSKSGHWNWPGAQTHESQADLGVVQAGSNQPVDPAAQVLQHRAHAMLMERMAAQTSP